MGSALDGQRWGRRLPVDDSLNIPLEPGAAVSLKQKVSGGNGVRERTGAHESLDALLIMRAH
jgi:hypothetical protein